MSEVTTMSDAESIIPQAASIPYRIGRDGSLEVLLIRRVGKKKWGIPKGLIDAGDGPRDTARIEAYEEAGAVGEVDETLLGTFQYDKFGGVCEVAVYAMHVTGLQRQYPESCWRERAWFSVDRAVDVLKFTELRGILVRLADTFERRAGVED